MTSKLMILIQIKGGYMYTLEKVLDKLEQFIAKNDKLDYDEFEDSLEDFYTIYSSSLERGKISMLRDTIDSVLSVRRILEQFKTIN